MNRFLALLIAVYAFSVAKGQGRDSLFRRLALAKEDTGKIAISVKDNGNGIPPKVVEKIFQPFFTTKPPGQGTGLGLSLSYDIIKAHGGELKVQSKEGEGTEFVILIPTV